MYVRDIVENKLPNYAENLDWISTKSFKKGKEIIHQFYNDLLNISGSYRAAHKKNNELQGLYLWYEIYFKAKQDHDTKLMKYANQKYQKALEEIKRRLVS